MSANSPTGSTRPHRIVVVGTTGSGKTTLAKQAAHHLGIPHIELDALQWGPDWTPAQPEDFCRDVRQALAGPTWTTDGNYSEFRDLIWGRADTVVWLDYPLPLILWRLFWRTLRRSLSGVELWSGNRETLRKAFLSRESLLLYALQTHRRRQRGHIDLFAGSQYAGVQKIQIASPRAAQRWLESLPEP